MHLDKAIAQTPFLEDTRHAIQPVFHPQDSSSGSRKNTGRTVKEQAQREKHEERPLRAAASHPLSLKTSAEGFCLLGDMSEGQRFP